MATTSSGDEHRLFGMGLGKSASDSPLITSIADLLLQLNHAPAPWEDWVEYLTMTPDSGVECLVCPELESSRPIWFLTDALKLRGLTGEAVALAVQHLCRRGAGITREHVVMLLDCIACDGNLLVSTATSPDLSACLSTSDRDAKSSAGRPSRSGRRPSPYSSRSNSDDDEERDPSTRIRAIPPRKKLTVGNVLSAMSSLVGAACVFVATGVLESMEANPFNIAWINVLASGEDALVDDVDDEHMPLVEDLVRKYRLLHALADIPLDKHLFSARSYAQWNYDARHSREFGPKFCALMNRGFCTGALKLPQWHASKLVDVSDMMPLPRLQSETRLAERCRAVVRENTHESDLMTRLIGNLEDAPLARDFSFTDETATFTIRAAVAGLDDGRVASVAVSKWLLLARWPWFRSLVLSGMEESTTSAMTLVDAMDPPSLFFIAASIYMEKPVVLNAWPAKHNRYWQEGLAACSAMSPGETGIFTHEDDLAADAEPKSKHARATPGPLAGNIHTWGSIVRGTMQTNP